MRLDFFEPLNEFEEEDEENQAPCHKQECLHNGVFYNGAKKMPGVTRIVAGSMKPSENRDCGRIDE